MKPNLERMKAVFKALSDETRLKIMQLLLSEERLCVLEIAEILGISQTASSRNLSILRSAGLLTDERKGPCTYYSIVRDTTGFCDDTIAYLRRQMNRTSAMPDANQNETNNIYLGETE